MLKRDREVHAFEYDLVVYDVICDVEYDDITFITSI